MKQAEPTSKDRGKPCYRWLSTIAYRIWLRHHHKAISTGFKTGPLLRKISLENLKFSKTVFGSRSSAQFQRSHKLLRFNWTSASEQFTRNMISEIQRILTSKLDSKQLRLRLNAMRNESALEFHGTPDSLDFRIWRDSRLILEFPVNSISSTSTMHK